MMLCNEELLHKFASNNEAVRMQMFNNGIRNFKGMLRALDGLDSQGNVILVNCN